MDQNQKDELFAWRTSAEGKAAIEANQTKLKAERNAKKQKRGGGGGNAGGGDDTAAEKAKADKATKKVQKNYQAAVAKVAKQLVASSIEAERAECAAADLSLEAAIKRRGNDPAAKISATSVVEDDEAEAEKEFTQSQTKIKLSAVKSRINKLKKGVTFRGWVHPASPVAGKRQQREAEPDDMIQVGIHLSLILMDTCCTGLLPQLYKLTMLQWMIS